MKQIKFGLIGQSNILVKKSSLSKLENLVAFFLAGFKLLWDWLGSLYWSPQYIRTQ